MNIIAFILVILVNVIFQSTLLPYFNIFGRVPNTALALIVVVALLKGKYFGAFFGLTMGLIQDILFTSVIGVNAFIYFLIGYLIGSARKSLDTENTFIHIVFTIVATIFYNSIYALFLFFLSRDLDSQVVLRNIVSLEIVYNSLIVLLLYKPMSRIFVMPSLKFGKK